MQELTISQMFQLEAKRPQIHSLLLSYILSKKYPWELLGKSLSDFLQELVHSIPLRERIQGDIDPRAYVEIENVVIEKGARVEAGAYIDGPCYISAGTQVRHAAYIRGSVFADCDVVIGHATEVKGSILFNNAKAGHFNYVGDSILGIDVNLGAGTKLANLKFNGQNVRVSSQHQKYDTGLKKLGGILGNGAQTGCNSVLNPGTMLLPGSSFLTSDSAHGIVR